MTATLLDVNTQNNWKLSTSHIVCGGLFEKQAENNKYNLRSKFVFFINDFYHIFHVLLLKISNT